MTIVMLGFLIKLFLITEVLLGILVMVVMVEEEQAEVTLETDKAEQMVEILLSQPTMEAEEMADMVVAEEVEVAVLLLKPQLIKTITIILSVKPHTLIALALVVQVDKELMALKVAS